MKTNLLTCVALCFTSLLCVERTTAQEAVFGGLGYLYENESSWSTGAAVSGDGSVITGVTSAFHNGYHVMEAFRWTAEGGMQGLSALWTTEPSKFFSQATNISGDGNTIVGYSKSENSNPWASSGWEGFKWTAEEGIMGLGDLTPTDFWSEATCVSGNGNVIAGKSYLTGQGFRWEDGSMESLSTAGIELSVAYGISGDGNVIVGMATIDGIQQAAKWVENEGISGLGLATYSSGSDVSADGNTIVGYFFEDAETSPSAFRWTEETGAVNLGSLGGAYVAATAVTDDGKIVVGTSGQNNDITDVAAFIWTEEYGMQNLQELMETTYGLDMTGWNLQYANGISGDGKTIVGTGINPNGKVEGWRIVLPNSILSAGIEHTDDLVRIYPNPTTGIINLQTRETIEAAYLYNAAGQKLSFDLLEGGTTSIDVSNLSSGVYILEIISENKHTMMHKIIKE